MRYPLHWGAYCVVRKNVGGMLGFETMAHATLFIRNLDQFVYGA